MPERSSEIEPALGIRPERHIRQRHGGLHPEEVGDLGVDTESILDLSVNVNPFGPSLAVREAIALTPLDRYPSPQAEAARRAIARVLDEAPNRIILGNGAAELIWALARLRLRKGRSLLLVEPTFSEMRAAADHLGAALIELRLRPEDDFSLDIDALDALLRDAEPALLYLCSPNNPSGNCFDLEAIAKLAEHHPATLFVIDLSFLSLSERAELPLPSRSEGVVWLRSLTKDHALAGLRLGVAVAPEAIVLQLESGRPPWSINALAQAAAIATTTPEAQAHVRKSRERLIAERRHLERSLRDIDLRAHPSETIYVLVDLGDVYQASQITMELLRRHQLLLRDATSFGLPNHLRIAARSAPLTHRVCAALRQELAR